MTNIAENGYAMVIAFIGVIKFLNSFMAQVNIETAPQWEEIGSNCARILEDFG